MKTTTLNELNFLMVYFLVTLSSLYDSLNNRRKRKT